MLPFTYYRCVFSRRIAGTAAATAAAAVAAEVHDTAEVQFGLVWLEVRWNGENLAPETVLL